MLPLRFFLIKKDLIDIEYAITKIKSLMTGVINRLDSVEETN